MRHLSATIVAKHTLWMCVALAAGIVAAWLVVVLATPAKPAEAAFPGKNGKIAFVSQRGGSDSEIFTIKANGGNEANLTNNGVDDFNPAFSANGKKIAFASNRSGKGEIFTMSPDGNHQKRVTRSESHDFGPAWSPEGTKIAFSSSRNGNTDIYVINQDGTGLTRLTSSPKADTQPAWSPDGTTIAFRRGNKIQVMKAARESETNRPKRLTTSAFNVSESDPAWSPNGARIAFASDQSAPGDTFDLYSIRADGSDQIRLTPFSDSEYEPAWSPNGTKMAFSWRGRIFVGEAARLISSDPVTDPKGIDSDSDWQPLH